MKKINMNFIPQNVAPTGAKRIVIFDTNGNEVATLPLGGLAPKHQGNKLYSFGALSDVHLPYAAQNASTDFQKALTYFNNVANVNFICISGDMSDKGTDAEWLDYKHHVDAYSPNTPVHLCTGNHDTAEDITYDYPVQYTGNPLWYSFEQNNDVFIMFGLRKWQGNDVFYNEALQWLYETLEENKDKRCFVFQHEMRLDGCGNGHGLYGWDGLSGRNGQVFLSLMEHYKNVIWFHGHSHTPFKLQSVQPTPIANYDRLHGCHSVHIPSLAIPRYGNSDVIFDAEGYVVDVYENGIHLRGIDFIEEEFVPIASYWIDTTPIEIPANSYVDTRGVIKERGISLPKGSELIMNQRYSYSENGMVTDTTTPSMFTVIIPVMPSTEYVLKIKNSNIDITTASGSVIYGLDSNKMPAQRINGSGNIPSMTTGITLSEDKKSADITFTTAGNVRYIALSLKALVSGTLKESDITDYIIKLEQSGNDTLPEQILKYTNLVPTSIDSDGSIYNSIGYKNESYVSSDGTVKDNTGTLVTGYIKTSSNIFYIYGAEFALKTYSRFKSFDVNFNGVDQIIADDTGRYETEDIGNGITKLTFDTGNAHYYIRFALYGTGENLYIYTIDDVNTDGFSTDLLDKYDVKLNQRWSASAGSTVASDGALYLEVPYSVIKGKTIKIMGFEPENKGTSTWYAYHATKTTIGRISNAASGTIWTLDSLRDNGDGSYEADISKEIFFSTSNAEPITFEPDIIRITMLVKNGTVITSTDGLRMLVSDKDPDKSIDDVMDEPHWFNAYIAGDTGNLATDANTKNIYATTAFISYNANKTYTFVLPDTADQTRIFYYDSNKSFISSTTQSTELTHIIDSVPNGTVYFRFRTRTTTEVSDYETFIANITCTITQRPTYNVTNIVPTAESVDSTAPFDGVGYRNNAYMSSSTNVEATYNGFVLTGLIPITVTTASAPTIYVRGVTIDTSNSYTRLSIYNSNKQIKGTHHSTNIAQYYITEELGEKYYKLTPAYAASTGNTRLSGYGTGTLYIRFSFKGVGENLVMTLDNPIN